MSTPKFDREGLQHGHHGLVQGRSDTVQRLILLNILLQQDVKRICLVWLPLDFEFDIEGFKGHSLITRAILNHSPAYGRKKSNPCWEIWPPRQLKTQPQRCKEWSGLGSRPEIASCFLLIASHPKWKMNDLKECGLVIFSLSADS